MCDLNYYQGSAIKDCKTPEVQNTTNIWAGSPTVSQVINLVAGGKRSRSVVKSMRYFDLTNAKRLYKEKRISTGEASKHRQLKLIS